MTAFHHVCFTVSDLSTAMADLTTATGVEWREPAAGRIGEWDHRIGFTDPSRWNGSPHKSWTATP